jgi:hypothetical protein
VICSSTSSYETFGKRAAICIVDLGKMALLAH